MTKKDNFSLSELHRPGASLFFAGIGGISMSALAFMEQKAGMRVSGYDATPSALTEKLEAAGIPVATVFKPELLDGVDLVIYTGAIHDTDPALKTPRDRGIPTVTRAEAFGEMMKTYPCPIGVSGTHGKSTTTGMLASVFMEAGRDPTVMVGAELSLLNGTYRVGGGEEFIFEACEYQDSFLSFFPRLSLILNVAHDHDDYFPTLEDVIASFTRFADLAKDGGAVLNLDDPGCREVAKRTKAPAFTFSRRKGADLWSENEKEEGGYFSFDAVSKEGLYARVKLNVPGAHNVSNALGALLCAKICGVDGEAAARGLSSFGGVRRRFERRGKCRGMTVYDDYAHHPDEIRATLTTARAMGKGPITVVFQPHTFSRTKAHWDEFVEALSLADRVITMDIYPAREAPIPGITSERLARDIPCGEYVGDEAAIARTLLESRSCGTLFIMGAGDVIHLTDKILTEGL